MKEGNMVIRNSGVVGMIDRIRNDDVCEYIRVRYINLSDGDAVFNTVYYTDNPIDFEVIEVNNFRDIKRMNPEKKKKMEAYIIESENARVDNLESRCTLCTSPSKKSCHRYTLTGCLWSK